MFDVQKPKQKPIVVIRAATGAELSEYETRKLASVEQNAQENRLEAVSLNIDGNKQQLEPLNKEVTINLGGLALKNKITDADISHEDLFIIKCELDATALED